MAHPHLRESYCLRTLERIHVTDRVIHRTQKLVEDTQAKLERILSEIEKERLLRDKIQENEAKIRSLSSQLLRLQLDLQDREKVHDSNNQFLLDISDDMHVLREQMRCDYKCLEEKKLSLADDKKKFYSCNYALLMRRNQLVTELFQIYPIHHSQGKYFICNIHLPDSEDFKGRNMLDVSVALGYVSHFLIMTSRFMDVPLRYCLVYNGSHSSIIDHIDPSLDQSQRVFPLHCQTGSKDKRIAFYYAVYLINKNISQLRHFMSLKTNDPRATLPNLYSLVEERCKIPARV